jgi:UDP-N-acetylglucosamine--N-acetylmuramyl-(pentapeptide) pyrophosphoryl-undecaprenol N-acetylglucosamine transferase
MKDSQVFVMAGGGTGGHVMPLLAVARELRARGHRAIFAGTRLGVEAALVPKEGFEIEWIEIGALKRVSALTRLRSLWQMPAGVARCVSLLGRWKAQAVFSLGGFVAGPVVLAAWLRRLPVVAMEPNAIPGFTNRAMARFVARAMVSFEQTMKYFPAGRVEWTGVPVREEFFRLAPKPPGGPLTVLITGGSQGSRTLNRAAREAWPSFASASRPVRILHQAGARETEALVRDFSATGLEGEVTPFIADMPAAFAEADLVVSRAGGGAVAEIAAAGRPSILVPFPYAADDHQWHNARALVEAGAARLVADAEMTGERLYQEIAALAEEPGRLERMGEAARRLARPGAARRAADLLEELARRH